MARTSPPPTPAIVLAHEPVLLFAPDELFFPTSVESFVGASRLFEVGPRDLTPEGGLSPINLGTGQGSVDRYVSLVAHQYLEAIHLEAARELGLESPSETALDFSAHVEVDRHGRAIARDTEDLVTTALESPLRLSKAIVEAAREMAAKADPPCYYYTVTTFDQGETAITYNFFYVMNDWATTHHKGNDHEGDWESVRVLLGPDQTVENVSISHHGSLSYRTPRSEGSALADRVQVYVAPGSHANYFEADSYRVWLDLGGLILPGYADVVGKIGRRLGATEEKWEPRLMPEWITGFQGCWGARAVRRVYGLKTVKMPGPRSPKG